MTTTMENLYMMLSEQVNADPLYRKEWKFTKAASLAVLEELEGLCGENCRDLLDVVTLLDGQKQLAHEQALFRAALRLGMELGRMSAG